MHHSAQAQFRPDVYTVRPPEARREWMRCDWPSLCSRLLAQWDRLTPTELRETGPSRRKLANLVERKYGIAPELVERYLTNLERTLPLM